MFIRWHGHACFELRSEGKVLVIDPHDGRSIGINPPNARADYVLVTHDHFDHNAVRTVAKKGAKIIREAEEGEELGPFKVKSFKVAHDPEGGSRRGMVNAYLIEAEGLKVVHLGDIGEVKEISEIVGVDVMMIPVGGYYTLGAEEAYEMVKKHTPKVAIPMHYRVHGLTLPIHDVKGFLEKFPKEMVVEQGSYVEVKKEDLEGIEETEVWVFSL